MKSLLRNTVFYSFALFLLPYIISGIEISGGVATIVTGGFVMTLLFSIVRPILNVIGFPFNFVTLGFFSVLINVFLLYVLTVLVPSIIINSFVFPGLDYAGFTIPRISFNTFFTFVVTAMIISAITNIFRWMTQ